MATLKANGVQLCYEDYGQQGAPVVILGPLFFADISVFEPIGRILSEDYRVICFDHRDSFRIMGGSGSESASATLESCETKDIVSLIESLELGPCHFFGSCLGVGVGLKLAIEHSDLLRSCILAGPSYQVAQGVKEGMKDLAEMWFGSTFRNTKDPIQVMRREKWLKHLAKMKPEELGRMRPVFHPKDKDMRKEFAQIRCDVMVLSGDEDSAENLETCRSIAKAIPGAESKTIQHAGYALVIEQPEEVAEAVKTFVAKVERRYIHRIKAATRENFLSANF